MSSKLDQLEKYPRNFIRTIIEGDLAAGKYGGRVVTRFPPEPNGYLHIGHAKAICLSFGLAQEFGGSTYLRFDDTNPLKESTEFKEAIKRDIAWLGFDWKEERHASDYFEDLYNFAEKLIEEGKAYVDSLSAEQIKAYRGTLTSPGKDSPFRERSPEESLTLFRQMRAGDFADGEQVLRLKLDMASPNINMRDPVIYRVRHANHHETGAAWCIYPLYDYAHCLSDSLEGVTHSLCDLGFEDHRPLYDWILDQLALDSHPQQIEFSRLSLQYTVMSKRKLMQLVSEGLVDGWDDPRLPTLAGLRRRGYTPESLRDFCRRIGVAKSDNRVALALLESCIREALEGSAPRALAVMEPLKLVIENYPEGKQETLTVANHPKNESLGTRELPFGREIYIERADFREEANRKYKRLVLGEEVRLRYGYVIKAERVVKDNQGRITEVRCSYDSATLGRNPEGRKARGVIHWVAAAGGLAAEFRLYEPLFTVDFPDSDGRDYRELLNPNSLTVHQGFVEPSLALAKPGDSFQFERLGYFCPDLRAFSADEEAFSADEEAFSADEEAFSAGSLVFNRIVSLRDTWAKSDSDST